MNRKERREKVKEINLLDEFGNIKDDIMSETLKLQKQIQLGMTQEYELSKEHPFLDALLTKHLIKNNYLYCLYYNDDVY